MQDDIKNKTFSLPNLLSFIRILIIPFFIIFICQNKAFVGFLLFLIASCTDGLDGFIARQFNQKTKLGQLLDPAADKLLMSSSYILLSFSSIGLINTIPIWLTICVLGRDILIVTGSFFLFRRIQKENIKVNLLGKITTVFQMTVIVFVLFFNWKTTSPHFLVWLYYLTLIFTILSGARYAGIGINLYKNSQKKTI